MTGVLRSRGSNKGVGYKAGSAVAAPVTQATNRSTGVISNGLCGQITTNNTSLAAEARASFVVTNSFMEIGDVVVLNQRSGANGGLTDVGVTAKAAGSFTISVDNNNVASGTAETGAIILDYAIIKTGIGQ